MSYKSDSVKIWGLLGNRLHNLTLSIRNNNLAFMNLRHVFNMGTFIGIYKCVCICRGSVRAISPVWSTSRTRSVPEGSGVFAVVQSYQDEVHVPSAARCTTQHTHTHTSTETNTSKHRYVVTYHMGRARGARFQGLSHRKWETRSEFSSSFQTNDPCSIVEHSPFPIILTFATKVFTSLMKLLALPQGITYLCISAADHSKQNLWVLE